MRVSSLCRVFERPFPEAVRKVLIERRLAQRVTGRLEVEANRVRSACQRRDDDGIDVARVLHVARDIDAVLASEP